MIPIDMDKAKLTGYSGAGSHKIYYYSLPSYAYSHMSETTMASYPWCQDRIRYSKSSPSRGPKPCIHERMLAKPVSNDASWADVAGGFYREHFVSGAAAMAGVYPTPGGHLAPNIDEYSILDKLMDDVAGRIKPGLLSMATIGEIQSLKGLSQSITGWLAALKRTALLKGNASDLISSHLGYIFGVKPLVNDLAESLVTIGAVRKHLNGLRKRNRLAWMPYSHASKATLTSDSGLVTTTRTVRYSCQACGTYNIDNVEELRTAIAYFGLDRPFSSAWELVPFSFIVDYATRIQNLADWLDGFIAQPIYNASVSIRHLQRTEKLSTSSGQTFAYGPFTGSLAVWNQTYTRFDVDGDVTQNELLASLRARGLSFGNALTTGEVAAAVVCGTLGKGIK